MSKELFEVDELIFQRGDRSEVAYVIESGQVEIFDGDLDPLGLGSDRLGKRYLLGLAFAAGVVPAADTDGCGGAVPGEGSADAGAPMCWLCLKSLMIWFLVSSNFSINFSI